MIIYVRTLNTVKFIRFEVASNDTIAIVKDMLLAIQPNLRDQEFNFYVHRRFMCIPLLMDASHTMERIKATITHMDKIPPRCLYFFLKRPQSNSEKEMHRKFMMFVKSRKTNKHRKKHKNLH